MACIALFPNRRSALPILLLLVCSSPAMADGGRERGWLQKAIVAKRDRLEQRIHRRLDASKFLNSNSFRKAERKLLKRAATNVLHPRASLNKATVWTKERAKKARDGVVWVIQHPREAARATKRGAKRAVKWAKANPKKALMWGVGLPAVLVVALPGGVAELVAAGVTNAMLAHGMGATTAAIIGTGAGGALASGASSAWAHGLAMVNGSDKPNPRRLVQDAGMSAVFGFVGFGVAQGMKTGAQALGLAGAGLKGYTWTGLMAFEMAKDCVQNGVNNLNIKIYDYHQANKDKRLSKVLRALRVDGVEDKDGSAKKWGDIWDSSFLLESATNTPRIFGNLTTNFAVKSVIDMGARVAWDRIIHGDHAGGKQKNVTKERLDDLDAFD